MSQAMLEKLKKLKVKSTQILSEVGTVAPNGRATVGMQVSEVRVGSWQ